ncbi:hypothetical protein BHE74_00017084 [Ensete ventricosum]|nr:hypothetical protein GW17_00004725 [Ensete ventricosum]RWW74916.1 hypothetical protein BHE74_00017084 [Ensete ventricosum]RZR98840.1 hypothetical protein BHM03_00028284 [Ensete ventricosum]
MDDQFNEGMSSLGVGQTMQMMMPTPIARGVEEIEAQPLLHQRRGQEFLVPVTVDRASASVSREGFVGDLVVVVVNH